MTFTEEDIPLMKLIFNPSTHDMGMLVGRERAEEIFEYVCNEVGLNEEYFIQDVSDFFERIFKNEYLCDFFWDNNILQLSFLGHYDVGYILRRSLIVGKIWDSGKLDLSKLDGDDISDILVYSPIAEKIWDSGKLNLSLLDEKDLEYFKRKFES